MCCHKEDPDLGAGKLLQGWWKSKNCKGKMHLPRETQLLSSAASPQRWSMQFHCLSIERNIPETLQGRGKNKIKAQRRKIADRG